MRTLSLLATAALLVVLPAAAAGRDPSVLAIDWRTPGREKLVRADPLTLHPRGAALDLAGHAWPYAFSPDRGRLVLGRWEPPSLQLVDVRRLRLLAQTPLGDARRVEIKAISWLGRHVVVLVERRPRILTLLKVDPARGRVVAETELGRWAPTAVATRTALAVLLVPIGRIGTARLLVITAKRVRNVALGRIAAGSIGKRRGKPYTVVLPGLAVSPDGGRAWVIGAARSAEVELETLAVRYRGEARHSSSIAKEPVVGNAREARWLAPGRLVVTGWDAARDGGKITFRSGGLRLLDTRAWSERTIHTKALLFYVRPTGLLTIAPGEPDCPAPVLTAYTLAGVERYRVCERRATGELSFAGPYARLGHVDGRVTVVDLATGSVVARTRGIRVNPLETGLVQEP